MNNTTKKKWLDGRLPFLIAHMPWDLDNKLVVPHTAKKHFYYDSVTDKKIIVDEQTSKIFIYVGSIIITLGLFFWILSKLNAFIIILIIIGSSSIIYAFTAEKKETILNRETGTITFPNWFYGKTRVLPFHTIKALWVSMGGASGALRMELRIAPENSIKGADVSMHSAGFEKDWSFMVWYMDKNRPLPPGTAFDKYRNKDFERRKAEGFPSPLYKSTFPTPEATPEQQQEREQFWKDEDHFGTNTNAWY